MWKRENAAVVLTSGILIALSLSPVWASDCGSLAARPLTLANWSVPSDPWGVAVDPQGYVFVTDPINHRICRTSASGQSPLYFGVQGNGPGQFQEPRWLACDGDRGLLYVSDQARRGVMVFDRDGNYLRTIGGGASSTDPGNFSGPNESIALDAAGNLYVAEINTVDSTFRARIQVFDPAGSFQRVFAQSSHCAMTPTAGVWCQFAALSIAPNGELFALEWAAPGASFANRVHRFAPSGVAVGIWGEDGLGPGQLYVPGDLACSGGNVWVSSFHHLLEFSPTGTLISDLGRDDGRDFQGIALAPGPIEIIFTGSFLMFEPTQQLEVLAKPILAHNALNSHWLDANNHLVPVAPALLGDCDDANVLRSGAAADGVAPLVLRYEFTKPCAVTWTLRDQDSTLGGGAELGSLSDVDGVQIGQTVTVSSVLVNGRYTAFAVYTAPIDFERPGTADSLIGERTVHVKMTATPLDTAASVELWRPLKIVRPPVAFVHGLWSEAAAWDDFKAMQPSDGRWRAYRVGYRFSHTQSFARNAGYLRASLNRFRADYGGSLDVATAQFDVITHSMGGCIVRTLAGSPEYRRPYNLGAGDVHKLLTLNTPHYGSALAASLVTLRNAMYAGSPSSRLAAQALNQFLGNGVLRWTLEDMLGPALDDLSPGSPALTALGPLPVPTHVHVGHGGSDLALTLGLLTGDHPVEALYFSLAVLTANLAVGEFLIEPHDAFVLDRSARGGLAPSQVTISHFIEGLHTEAVKAASTGALAKQWALASVADGNFFGTLPAVSSGNLLASTNDFTVPPYGGKTLTISPAFGSAVPGADYAVTVESTAGTDLADAIVAYPGGILHLHAPNLTGTLHIPVDSYGTLDLSCMGLTTDGHLVESSGASVNVQQATAPDSISVEPRQLEFSGPGEVQPVRVLAHFPDGVARDLSNVQGSIAYNGYNPLVARALAGRGEFQARQPGSTTVTVTFAGMSCELAVVVHDGEPITNPPHAVIVPPGPFCAGRQICLDGSTSYDDDTLFGDVLSYHWDLDNDGQFDDAAGPNACVTLLDGSQTLLVGLEVVDSDGLASRDIARLTPQNGCHDAIGICQVGPANHGYPAFVFVRDIGLDASGRYHVFVQPLSPGPGRVVRFTRDCQYDGEISVPVTVHAIAVSPTGVVYCSDVSDVPQIRRFALDGSELAPIMLPAVSDEELYQDDIDFDEEGNICVAVTTYGESGGFGDYAVHTINEAGQLVRRVAAEADLGITVDFNHPIMDFKVAADGSLFFTQRDAVYRAQRTGNAYALSLTIPGGSHFHLALDATASLDGTIYVGGEDGVHRFATDGTFAGTRTGAGISPPGDAFASIQALDVDPSGRVYVAEFYGRAEVFRFDPENVAGVEPPPASQPTAAGGGLRFANPYRPLMPITLSHAADGAPVQVLIYNVQGSCVRKLSLGPAVSNPMTFTWDGYNSGGARVAPGVYYLRAVVGQTAYRQKLVLIR